MFVLFLLFAGVGSAVTATIVSGLHYTETASFCGRCHTMGPEMKAYRLSPHRQVACAECHVEEGLKGTLKAKANGSRQLLQVLTGTYPKPIPPPEHSQLPPVRETCLRCHSVEEITKNDGPVHLVLRPKYQPDKDNTRELVAVVLRPEGLSAGNPEVRGVHWHVQEKVTYYSDEAAAKTMDLVEIAKPDGSVRQYVAGSTVVVSADVRPDIARVKRREAGRVMDCLDCHNRTGHGTPSVDQAVDDSLAAGRISVDLPYIKRDAVALLGGDHRTPDAADRAIDQMFAGYGARYPLVPREKKAQVAATAAELKRLYREVATPEMRVNAQTYADNLGHQKSPGCFRCHDGAHYLVTNGKAGNEVIPSTCSTCHTFPQLGGRLTGLPLGGAPATHQDELYVFNHKKLVSNVNPERSDCGACHDRTYCENCHSTGAAKVTHDQMLYNHAASIRRSGGPACAYCHQAVYCARCHRDPVLQTAAQGSRGG